MLSWGGLNWDNATVLDPNYWRVLAEATTERKIASLMQTAELSGDIGSLCCGHNSVSLTGIRGLRHEIIELIPRYGELDANTATFIPYEVKDVLNLLDCNIALLPSRAELLRWDCRGWLRSAINILKLLRMPYMPYADMSPTVVGSLGNVVEGVSRSYCHDPDKLETMDDALATAYDDIQYTNGGNSNTFGCRVTRETCSGGTAAYGASITHPLKIYIQNHAKFAGIPVAVVSGFTDITDFWGFTEPGRFDAMGTGLTEGINEFPSVPAFTTVALVEVSGLQTPETPMEPPHDPNRGDTASRVGCSVGAYTMDYYTKGGFKYQDT